MAVTDIYKPMKSEVAQVTFTKLYELKKQKKSIDDEIKKLEKFYKDDIKNQKDDLFYELPSGLKFSIKKSIRKGGYDNNKVAKFIEEQGFISDDFKKDDTEISTLRFEDK